MIQDVSSKKIRWVMVTQPTKHNLAYLREHFHIDNEDLAVTLPPLQRQRIMVYDHYALAIFQFPYFDRKAREIRASELDIFISKNFLITVTDGNLSPLENLFDDIADRQQELSSTYKDESGLLLVDIVERLQDYLFPMLNHISQDLDSIEKLILHDLPTQKNVIYTILNTKRNIVNFRRIMQAHRAVVNKLISDADHLIDIHMCWRQFQGIISHTVEVWGSLENFSETINALHETHESLLNFRTNTVIKTLTVFSVIVFPLTLLAAIFGMNTSVMPLVSSPHGFWIIVVFMMVGAIGMYSYFKYRRWI